MKKIQSTILAIFITSTWLFAHGNVTPQAVDTKNLPKVDISLIHNPYRDNTEAFSIGKDGYEGNCARCHGIEAISGGIAPDLRYLEKGDEGDEYFIDIIQSGVVRNGNVYMPPFKGVLSTEAMWAIRTYIEKLHTTE